MQTFLPCLLYKDSARVLDNRRLGKQRVECLQLLHVLQKGPWICSECKDSWPDDPCCGGMGKPMKTPWYNHPAARMWKGFEKQLAIYGLYICNEWIARGFNDTCFQKIQEILRVFDPHYQFQLNNYINYGSTEKIQPWMGNNAFHASHRSNLLRKDPVWYGQFGWSESPDLPYYWPVVEIKV